MSAGLSHQTCLEGGLGKWRVVSLGVKPYKRPFTVKGRLCSYHHESVPVTSGGGLHPFSVGQPLMAGKTWCTVLERCTVVQWRRVVQWCTVVQWRTVLQWFTVVQWCIVVQWHTVVQWCTVVQYCTIVQGLQLYSGIQLNSALTAILCGAPNARKNWPTPNLEGADMVGWHGGVIWWGDTAIQAPGHSVAALSILENYFTFISSPLLVKVIRGGGDFYRKNVIDFLIGHFTVAPEVLIFVPYPPPFPVLSWNFCLSLHTFKYIFILLNAFASFCIFI